jgi:hypothetical protein
VNGASWPAAFGDDEGSMLIEVLVALVLVTLLLVPLANGVASAVGRAEDVQVRAQKMSGGSLDTEAMEAWDWGPEVVSAEWRPGPVLDLTFEACGDSDRVVGVWIDGWFLGEHSLDSDGGVHLTAPELGDCGGGELVVRVRESASPWGVPWRLIVPGGTGTGPSSEPASGAAPSSAAKGETEESVAHTPGLSNPLIEFSWAADVAETEPGGLPFVVPVATVGRCEATLDDRTQSWLMEAARALDLYF